MKYEDATEGEWFPIKKRGWGQKCCHCGMTHQWDFRTKQVGSQIHIEARVKVSREPKRK